jgi:hypothetical protein
MVKPHYNGRLSSSSPTILMLLSRLLADVLLARGGMPSCSPEALPPLSWWPRGWLKLNVKMDGGLGDEGTLKVD